MRTWLICLGTVLALSAVCRGQATDITFDPNKPYTLEIVTWTADKETEGLTWERLVREYQRFRPNVRIKKEIQSNKTYESWATTQFVSGTAPDIMQSFPWKAHQWGAAQHHLVPLREFLNQPNPLDGRDPEKYPTWMSCLYEELLEQNADPYYGEIWTIPLSLNTQRFFYNKDIFKRLDLQPPRTFSEMSVVCRAIREKSAGTIVPIAMPKTGAWLDYIGAGINASLTDEYDVIKPDAGVTAAELLVTALQGKWDARTEGMYSFYRVMKRMNDENWFQEGWTGFDTNQADNLFTNGTAAIIREGYWMKEGFDKRIAGAFEFGVMREPYIDKEFVGGMADRDIGRMLEMMASYGSEVAVTQACKDRGRLPAAIDFLRWITSPKVAEMVSEARGAMPSTRDLDPYLPEETRVFKPEIGGRPGGPTFYNASRSMQSAMGAVAPLYVSGQMELSELRDFMSQYQDRFVKLLLRETQESTRAGLFTGTRYYARFMYDQELLRRRADQPLEGDNPALLARQRESQLTTCATIMDNLTDTEDIVVAMVASAYPKEGPAGFRHVPIITEERASLLGDIAMVLSGLGLVGVAIWLLRKRRIARMMGFPEKSLYVFIMPTLIFILAFSYYPALSGIYHAFTRWDGANIDEFIGLANFKEMFTDQILAVSAVNLIWMLAAFFLKLVPPLICAVVLYHVASERLRYYFRVMFVLPMIVPGIVYWMVWKLFYQPAPSGVFNQILIPVENFLHNHGMDVSLAYNWLADPRTALGAIIFLGFPWVGTMGVLIYLAGLENIDPGLFEAAEIDGAGFLKKFWYIEIPLLMRQIKLNLVLGLIGAIQGFGQILFLTQGGPAYSTTVPGYQMYTEAFTSNRMGYASAIGLAMFVVILLATMTAGRAAKAQD